jgi:hypothetical protein
VIIVSVYMCVCIITFPSLYMCVHVCDKLMTVQFSEGEKKQICYYATLTYTHTHTMEYMKHVFELFSILLIVCVWMSESDIVVVFFVQILECSILGQRN